MISKPKIFPDPDWKKAVPEEIGEDPGSLLTMVEQLDENDCGLIRAFFVKHGKVFLDYCPYPYRRDLPFTVYSVSKSITGTAIGLAIAEGFLKEEDTLLSFYPEYSPLNINSFKKQIRIKDLLTMSCGHRYADWGYPGGDPEYESYPQPDSNKTFVERFLDQPVLHPPGTHFVYNTDGILVLCDLIYRLTGEPLYNYLVGRPFKKIGNHSVYCDGNNGGHGYCFWLVGSDLGYTASGLFGQHLFVLDDKDTVCVINALKETPGSSTVSQIFKECFIEGKGKGKATQEELQDLITRKEKEPNPV